MRNNKKIEKTIITNKLCTAGKEVFSIWVAF